jgi:hypothetical protein
MTASPETVNRSTLPIPSYHTSAHGTSTHFLIPAHFASGLWPITKAGMMIKVTGIGNNPGSSSTLMERVEP